jgi:hypothetical protein
MSRAFQWQMEVVGLALLMPFRLAAQEVPDSSLASVCDRAAATVAREHSGQQYYLAVSDVASCPQRGAPALIGQWQRPPRDTVALRVLGEVSPRIRDGELFLAVRQVFMDPTRPRLERLAALNALVGYYNPRLSLRFPEPGHGNLPGSAYVMIGMGNPVITRPGGTPLTATVQQDVLRVLSEVGSTDPDERVRKIASYVAGRLPRLPQS